MNSVLVTGGAGFIGSNLVKELLKRKIDVRVIDDLSSGDIGNIPDNVEFLQKDLATISREELYNFMKDVDHVFHLAAKARVQPSIEDPITFNKANVDSTLNLLFTSKQVGVKRFIYSASSSCYGDTNNVPTPETADIDPLSPYALQKYVGEEYCKLFSKIYNLDTVCLRYFNVYGDSMKHTDAYSLVLSIWKNQHENNLPLTVTGDGKQRRDFTNVNDVVQANIFAALHEKNLKGESFNVGSGVSLSMNEVVEIIGSEYVYTEKRLEPFETRADNTKIRKVLGWEHKGNLHDFIKRNFK